MQRDATERLRVAQEEAASAVRRREELEQRFGSLEGEYEELLGESCSIRV